jgi:hypothetical protein
LDDESLAEFLGEEAMRRIFARPKEPEALSDEIRVELLRRWGGVWADATAMCAKPLDEWLPQKMTSGFFAFERPTADRMLASWFLAATPRNYIIEKWHDSVLHYWEAHTARDDYFWFHNLFAAQYAEDAKFRALWDLTPTLPAKHDFHFSPDDPRLRAQPPPGTEDKLKSSAPVFKLTHKLPDQVVSGSMLELLCRFGRGELET